MSTKKKAAGPTAQSKNNSKIHRYRSLVDIGIALSSEKEISRILDLILDKALENTDADAASISLTESIRIDSISNMHQKYIPVLRYHRNAKRSGGKRTHDRIITIDSSTVAGHVAQTGETVKVDNCHALTGDEPFKWNPSVGIDNDYETISILAVPMPSSNGKVRGVLKLLNKIRPDSPSFQNPSAPPDYINDIIPFTDEDVELMQVFASQASVAIENAKLTEDIENLFESFIRASVTAIEARDPSTSGHSDRVAVLTVEFARAIHQCPDGPMKNVEFSEQQIRELRYAALLHDFGKIGVQEAVLRKKHKLYPHEMETILLRLDSARARQEMLAWKHMAEDLVEMFDKGTLVGSPRARLSEVSSKIDQFALQLQQVRLGILKANQPQIVEEDFDIASLIKWINQTSRQLDQMLVTPEEMIKLSLPRGSLGEEERKEIESHVTHTYHFLRQIAWTEDLSNVADIAHAHHEKCDGSGYPRGLVADHIPVQSKLMTISDIYDALTSMDRPYKPATTPERALEILHWEARRGKLDLDLLKIFIEAKVFQSADGMRQRRSA